MLKGATLSQLIVTIAGCGTAAALIAVWVPAAHGKQRPAEMGAMDGDGDGKLTPEEHAAAARRMFAMMDANKDGRVTAAEMDAAQQLITGRKSRKGQQSAAAKIAAIDSDGDGILTEEEHQNGARTMFGRMDADADGLLSKAELAAGHKALRKPADDGSKDER